MNGDGFTLGEGARGVVLVHGFTASAQEVEGLAAFLAERGFRVAAPLLAGHNASFEDFARTTALDYVESVVRAYDELEGCESVDVVGLSFGAILGIHLATLRPVRRLVLLAPAFRLLGLSARLTWLGRRYRGRMQKAVERNPKTGLESPWDLNDVEACERRIAYDFFGIPQLHGLQRLALGARKELRASERPLLVIHSRGDRTASFDHARREFDRAAAGEKRFVELTESGHVVTDDLDRARVADEVLAFLAS